MLKQFSLFSKLLIAVFFISITVTSCSSGDSDLLDEELGDSISLTTLINGDKFTTDDVTGLGSSSLGYFSITALKENQNEGIDFTLPNATLGTYEATGDFDTQVIATYFLKNDEGFLRSYGVLSGSVTITENTEITATIRRVKGNFSFTCTRENSDVFYEITEGNFDIEYLFL